LLTKGKEPAREVSATLKNEGGVDKKAIASRDPQANSAIERCHKALHNAIRSAQIKDKRDPDEFFGFKGVSAARQKAVNSTGPRDARRLQQKEIRQAEEDGGIGGLPRGAE